MKELKELFSQNHSGAESFNEIADILLNGALIVVNEKQYRITEIEFYWNNGTTHQDKSTYKRTHVGELKAGQLFFHYSRFDIVLDNEFGYGGILIRGVYDIAEGKAYKGPMVSCMRIFTGIQVFGDCMSIELKKFQLNKYPVKTKSKVGIGKNGIEGGFNVVEYNYSIQMINRK